MHIGNPSDTDLLRPAIERITRGLRRNPRVVTADRGYWDSTIEADLAAAGVTTVVIPRTGKCSAARAPIEHADDFVEAVKWRTGSEGRISHLKRDWAWRRTRLRGHAGRWHLVRPRRLRSQRRQARPTATVTMPSSSLTAPRAGRVSVAWVRDPGPDRVGQSLHTNTDRATRPTATDQGRPAAQPLPGQVVSAASRSSKPISLSPVAPGPRTWSARPPCPARRHGDP